MKNSSLNPESSDTTYWDSKQKRTATLENSLQSSEQVNKEKKREHKI